MILYKQILHIENYVVKLQFVMGLGRWVLFSFFFPINKLGTSLLRHHHHHQELKLCATFLDKDF
jgi:hypothetical protein